VVIGIPQATLVTESWHWLLLTIVGTALLSSVGITLALFLARRISNSIEGLIAPALALGRGEPMSIGKLELAETREVGESLLKASQLIQQRVAEHERAEAARREAEGLRRYNAELERSEAEAGARATELAAIMDAVPAIVFIGHDRECRHITSNRAAYDLLRLPAGSNTSFSAPEGERPMNYWIMRDGRKLSPNELPMQLAAATGRAVRNYEYTFAFNDGSSREVFGSAVPLLADSGEVRGAVGTFIDITERKKAEEKIHTLEDQLRQAQKMEAVGRLAGGVAHDFNNILMVIQSYTEMLQDRLPIQDSLRMNTEQVLKAAARGASLTGQMLAFSRKQILSPVVLDLDTVVSETARMLKRLLGEDIEFRINSAASLWKIEADPDQIVQVLMNLCVNARDAMPQGGTLTVATGTVTVDEGDGAHSYLLPGEYVMLSVTDTGTGISEDLREQIFEPFFTTKEVGKGTGLGLAMVYGVVKQSGGYVWVDSKIGEGACFKIYLPRVKGVMEPEISAKAEVRPRGTETLLVAEDEGALREAVCDYLQGLGYTVLAASSGHEALLMACQHEGRIDLLITDVVMPKMSGRELSEMLGSRRPDLKTVYMSGYTNDTVLRHGIRERGATFLQKPFSLGTLARKVRETLAHTVQS
jgi:signal transduction histidine kinase/ActR/RegA family two-component response regulator